VRGFLALALVLAVCVLIAGCGGSSASSGGRAAVVNGNDVSMRSYDIAFQNARLQTIDNDGYDPCQFGSGSVLCSGIKQQAMLSVIQAELIREYAANHHISVSQSDLNRQWQLVYNHRFDGRQDVLTAWLKHVYSHGGLHQTAQDLKNGIGQDLLQQKVMYAVIPRVPVIEPGMRLAVIQAANASLSFVQTHLRNGQNFVALANNLAAVRTSQCQALKCGELGWVPTELVPQNRKQLLAARAGSIVGPYKGQLVFELYKVEMRAPRILLTSQQQYQIRVNRFAAWLATQVSHAKVTRYVAV
jgi:hypothetical protein